MNRFLAGVGRALLIKGNDLIGVAKTLTDSTFDFSITGEDVRGGAGNALWGKYFHDSALNVTLTDAMFNLQYVAAALGTNVVSGGLSIAEEEVVATAGGVTVANTPIATNGTIIGWYKLPADDEWNIGTFEGNTMAITGATAGTAYCVKYFYQNENARSITIKTQYVPAELHVVIINDLFNGDISTNAADTTKIGRLITDIPRLQLDGSQNLALTASGAATVSLSGSALAVASSNTCEEDPYYGTMTEEIFGSVWQDSVVALAIADAEIELAASETQTLSVYAVFGSGMAAARKDNSNFTFTVQSGTSASVSSAGVVTANSAGETVIEVTLTDYDSVSPAYAYVTVSE